MIMVRREVFQVSILLCFFLVFWAVNSSRGAEQPTLPKEAQEVLQGFQQALTDANWAKAMSYCSAEVKKKAAQTESLEAFLKDVVPLAEVISIDVNRMSGWGGGARGQDYQGSLRGQGCGRELAISAWMATVSRQAKGRVVCRFWHKAAGYMAKTRNSQVQVDKRWFHS
jgi:hypothetical protein